MSTLSSTSTDAQIWSAYDDNASFEENQSATQAAAFITACVILLRRRPTQMTVGGQTMAFEEGSVRGELRRARRWYAMNRSGSGAGVRFIDVSGLRDDCGPCDSGSNCGP